MQETWVRLLGREKSPGEGNGNATPVFLPGKSYGQRSLVDYSPRDRKESDTTEQLYFLSLSFYSNHIASLLLFGLAKLIPTSDALHTPPSICGLLHLISLSFRFGISYNLKHFIQNFSHHIYDLPCFF